MTQIGQSRSMRDRRGMPRVATTLRGKTLPGPLDCTIADFTLRGARLRFPAGAPEDERMTLIVWSTGLAFEGVVRWRAGDEIGVRFVQRCHFGSVVPAKFHEARALWQSSRPKFRRPVLRTGGGNLLRRNRTARPPESAPTA
jgi:hypothetical protein